MQEAFHECHAPPVRLLHAGDDHAVGRPAQRQPEPDRGGDPRRARGQPVPLHRLPQHRQARPCTPREHAGEEAASSDRHRGRPGRAGDRQRPPPQGGPAADHRPHPLDRQHHRCPGCCTSPWCAARSRTRRSPRIDTARGQGRAQRRRRAHRRGPRRRAGRAASTPGRSPPTRWRPHHPPMRGRPGRLRRRDRRRRRRPHRRRGARRRRAGRRRLRRAAGRARPQGGRARTRSLAHPDLGTNKSRALGLRLRARPAPAATSRRPSRRPAPTAS